MSIREEIHEENKKNFKEMTFKQKIKHFWHYYKIHLGVAAIVLAFVTYLVLHYTVFKPLPYGFVGYALNTNYYVADDLSPVDNFIKDFAVDQNINTEEYQVIFDVSNAIDLESTDMLYMAMDMKLVTEGENGDMDVLIGTAEQLEYYIINGFYKQPLDELLPEEMFQELDEQGLIYYYENEEAGSREPLGIYVTDAPRLKELGLYNEDAEVMLGIVSLSPRTDMAVEFVRYIFETP